ncbi:protein ORF109 [Cyprinid herpesvirus 1]|uniref:Protein ORF109 n=1 Tax=Cyprinid herpesvirus 1 TaxID=317858 RepID=K7PCL3_9VIRU|nr:protein ORF109 [Cyprinid herpesvirus 1]AFJ20405.1 protein ORF109 [Cyprinid herpesvirus 1]
MDSDNWSHSRRLRAFFTDTFNGYRVEYLGQSYQPPSERVYTFQEVRERQNAYADEDSEYQGPVSAYPEDTPKLRPLFDVCKDVERELISKRRDPFDLGDPNTTGYLKDLPKNDLLTYLMLGSGQVLPNLQSVLHVERERAKVGEAILSYPLLWSPLWARTEPAWFKMSIGSISDGYDFRSHSFDEAWEQLAEVRRFCSRVQYAANDEVITCVPTHHLEAEKLSEISQHAFKLSSHMNSRMKEYTLAWHSYACLHSSS